VRLLRSPRFRSVDLTRYMCGARRCFPVVGGALVYKDDNHLTLAFAKTLGPLVERRLMR